MIKINASLLSLRRKTKAQAVIEIALFGAILIFLIGVILRTHLSYSFSLNHQVRAMKLALKQSYKSSLGSNPTSSRNSGSVLFIEDRLSPDFNKFNTIDRSPFVANGSGTMTNRLDYPVDFGEVDQNLPIMDVFVNGQHFPLTTAAYVFRIIYDPTFDSNSCPGDWVGSLHGLEFARCKRQVHEWANGKPTFYTLTVNGTSTYNAQTGSFDLLRNDWDVFREITPMTQTPTEDNVPTGPIRNYFAWQWQPTVGEGPALDLGSGDNANYPTMDYLGTLHEQTLYAVTQMTHAQIMNILTDSRITPYLINPSVVGYPPGNSGYNLALTESLDINAAAVGHRVLTDSNGCNPNIDLCLTRSPGAGPITGVVVLDYQMGDIDQSYDPKSSPGPQPGLNQQTSVYSWTPAASATSPGTYLQIKEGKLYNPETSKVVRSVSSKDHVDLVSRMIQLSNNTQRFCKANSSGAFAPVATIPDQGMMIRNPVEACGDCSGANINKTCFDPISRVLFVRTLIGDTTIRKWFTDATKGL